MTPIRSSPSSEKISTGHRTEMSQGRAVDDMWAPAGPTGAPWPFRNNKPIRHRAHRWLPTTVWKWFFRLQCPAPYKFIPLNFIWGFFFSLFFSSAENECQQFSVILSSVWNIFLSSRLDFSFFYCTFSLYSPVWLLTVSFKNWMWLVKSTLCRKNCH